MFPLLLLNFLIFVFLCFVSDRNSLSSKTGDVSQALSKAGFDVDYVETRYGRRFVAARIGEHPVVRLIDNVPVAM